MCVSQDHDRAGPTDDRERTKTLAAPPGNRDPDPERDLLLRMLADQSPEWDYWVGPDGIYRHVSPACESVSGYPPEAFLQDPGLFRELIHPDDRDRWDRHLSESPTAQTAGALQPDELLELRLRTRDGQERWIEHRCRSVRDASGLDLGRRGVNRDIDRRKTAEELLRRATQIYAARSQLNQELLRTADEPALFQALCRIAVETGGLRGCVVALRGSGPDGTPIQVASAGIAADLLRRMPRIPGGQGSTRGTIAQAGDAGSDAEWLGWARAAGSETCWRLPFYRGEEPAGLAVYLGAYPGALLEETADLLSGLTGDLSFGIGQLHRQAQEAAARLALAHSEANLKALIRAAPVGIGTVRDRLYIEVNDRMCEMVGYPREALLGQSTRILFPSDAEYRRVGEALYPRLADDGIASLDIRLRRRDGQVIDALLTSAPIDRADLSRGVVATLLDVTQPRRDQALLEARVELAAVAAGGDLDALLRASLAAAERLTQSRIGFIHLLEPDGEHLRFQSWSDATVAAGCVAFDGGGHAPVGTAGVWADAVRQGEPTIHNDYGALARRRGLPEGHVPLQRELVVPVLQGGLAVAVLGVGNKPEPYTDSDRDALLQIASMAMANVDALRAQQALRQHARVFESTSEGVMITDANGRILAVNQSFLSITGYSEPEVLGQSPRLLSSGRHEQDFYEHMWESLAASGQWRGEIWNRRKDGAVYPEWLTISAVTEPDGRTSHYVAVFSDITQIKRAQERLDFLAHHDALTGLPNRLLLQDRLDHAIRHAQREGRRLALMFLDLDGFKDVNDTLGHAVGDRLLEVVAERLGKRLRTSDTLARLGGDEFLIVLEDDTGTAAASAAAEACLRLLAAPIRIRGHEIHISGSIGISLFPTDGQDAETLLASADLAMYRAKADGRNTFQFYAPEMTASALERQALENALRGALQRGEMQVYYQAQVELATRRLCGVEALPRWVHPHLGLVPPGRFIPIAEGIGIVAEIDEWMLGQACRQLAAWRATGFHCPRVAVNCSKQPLERGTLVSAVSRALKASGIAPADLELEVAESTIMGKGARVIAALADLRALGVRLVVDDFGTGYSALGRLNRIPLDRIKIDASFIRDIGRDPKDEAVARALVGLGNDLGLEVLAEGVEREDQVALLMREGCRYAQGYLFGSPVPPAILRANWGDGSG